MKNDANPPSTPATTISIAKMPMLVAIAIGESALPKHTGHASALRGTSATTTAISATTRSRATTLQLPHLALERRAVDDETDAAHQRRDRCHHVAHFVRPLVLAHRPRGEERREHDRQR